MLMIFGIQATNSFSSDVSRFFTGSPTDKAVWMLIAGAIVGVIDRTALWRLPRFCSCGHRVVPGFQSARAQRDGTFAGHRLRRSWITDGFPRLLRSVPRAGVVHF